MSFDILDPVVGDRLNAGFEAWGAYWISLSIKRLYYDKLVRGIAWEQVGFWTLWGYWNLYYYWAVGSAWSWWAGIAVTIVNTVYLSGLIYYTRLEMRYGDSYERYLKSLT